MAFPLVTLHEVPYDAFSLVEDVEYGIRLGLAGHRVQYAGEAQVLGEMVSSERGSRSQRQRWEGGRWALARRQARQLLGEALRRRSVVLLDLAADLLVPPLTYVALAAVGGAGASAVWVALGHGAWWSLAPWCVALAGLAVYIIRGVWLSGTGMRGILDLLWVPVYLVWKLTLARRASSAHEREWVRTTREEREKP
jgi:cellulose synthase/poly-beta-1,6-N-acetylglucosamine synthase-like glycosyltransferase